MQTQRKAKLQKAPQPRLLRGRTISLPHDENDIAHVVKVANAVLAAKRYDPLRAACGLVLFASALAEHNKVARTTVALVMFELALELDPDLFSARRWQ